MWSVSLFSVLLIFFIGSCVGSFLNVVVIRSLLGQSWWWGRSRCDTCQKILSWYELSPLVSFLVLGGKCRNCKKEIDIMHPVVEVLTGSLFVWWWIIGFAFFQLGTQPLQAVQALFWLCIGVAFVAILISDFVAYIIPDWTLLWIFFSTLTYRLLLVGVGIYNPADFARAMLLGCVFLLFFLSLWLITKGKGMGFGDVKFVFVLGVLLGWPNGLVAVSIAFLSGAVVGVGAMIVAGKNGKTALPFGPFLITGAIVALVWGENLVQWYQGLLRM
jgi:prepilin signal peptidase PulO-like enzyme (type II secretory pathway)